MSSLPEREWWPEFLGRLCEESVATLAEVYGVSAEDLDTALRLTSRLGPVQDEAWWPEILRLHAEGSLRDLARRFGTNPRRIRRGLARVGVRAGGEVLGEEGVPALVPFRARLGQEPDGTIAAEAGVPVEVVQGERRRLDIEPYRMKPDAEEFPEVVLPRVKPKVRRRWDEMPEPEIIRRKAAPAATPENDPVEPLPVADLPPIATPPPSAPPEPESREQDRGYVSEIDLLIRGTPRTDDGNRRRRLVRPAGPRPEPEVVVVRRSSPRPPPVRVLAARDPEMLALDGAVAVDVLDEVPPPVRSEVPLRRPQAAASVAPPVPARLPREEAQDAEIPLGVQSPPEADVALPPEADVVLPAEPELAVVDPAVDLPPAAAPAAELGNRSAWQVAIPGRAEPLLVLAGTMIQALEVAARHVGREALAGARAWRLCDTLDGT